MCHNVSEELSYDAYTESLDLINKNRVQIKMSKNSNMPFTCQQNELPTFT